MLLLQFLYSSCHVAENNKNAACHKRAYQPVIIGLIITIIIIATTTTKRIFSAVYIAMCAIYLFIVLAKILSKQVIQFI